jgi:hypothetical protein
VDASGEGIHRELLLSDIEDLDLRLRHTTTVARLDVRLVLDVTGALPRTYTRRAPSVNITLRHTQLCQQHALSQHWLHDRCFKRPCENITSVHKVF